MKVLVFAYACEPNRGSEPGLGWNISSEIAKRHELTLVVRRNNREKIEEYLKEHPESPHGKTEFVYVDYGCFIGRIKKLVPFGTQLYFSRWLREALSQIGPRLSEFDVVHQLTFSPFFVRPWGADLTRRYVWGPVGGGGGYYARFDRKMLQREPIGVRLNEFLYQALYWLVERSWLGISFRRTRSRVKAVLFKSTAFSAGYVCAPGQIVRVTRETGYSGVFKDRSYRAVRHPLQLLSVGNLIPSKAFGYAILAFARYLQNGGEGRLTILGDGKVRPSLERLVKELHVDGRVILAGRVPNAQVHEMLETSDVFFFPSFSEATPWALIEAMVHGLPIVCHNRSGMADIVVPSCGTVVTTDDPDELVELYADALLKYYQHPEMIEAHGRGSVERVKSHYMWEDIGKQFDEIYEQVKGR